MSLLCTSVSWNGCGAGVATGDSGDAAGMAAGSAPGQNEHDHKNGQHSQHSDSFIPKPAPGTGAAQPQP